MDINIEKSNNIEDFTSLSLYLDKVFEILSKKIIDYQSE